MKHWVLRILYRVWVSSGGYFALSRLLRCVLPSQRQRISKGAGSIAPPTSIQDVTQLMAQLEWARDDLWSILDYFRHPEAVWHALTIDGRIDPGEAPGDCDDWAALIAWFLEDIPGTNPLLFNVVWINEHGRFSGHNVCVFTHQDKLAHISNWRVHGIRGQPFIGFSSYDEVAVDIATGGVLVGWTAVNPGNLKVLESKTF